jgi:hypothetical protein
MDLLETSRQEHALYRDLAAVYRQLALALADPAGPIDRAWLAGRQRDADVAAETLRQLSAALAPHRLTGTPVPAEVRALWSASAALAAEVRTANQEATRLALARRAGVAARLVRLAEGQRALAGYRPREGAGAGFTHRHA